MEYLKDLHELGQKLRDEFEKAFVPEDIELPMSFKKAVEGLGEYKYNYKKYLVHISSEQLNGYIPNQWFIIASFFVDYYIEVLRYKEKTVAILKEAGINKTDKRKEILSKYTKLLGELSKTKPYEDAKNEATTLVRDEVSKYFIKAQIEEEEKEKLLKFVSDYDWWYGGKTIDRGDFYVSPILSLAKVVNASHSYIAEICKFFADNRSIANDLKNSYISEKQADSRRLDSLLGLYPLQQIFYGAPGTGKSHKINDTTKLQPEENVFRTTFHPDSDYSTFVGCYKPSMKRPEKIYTEKELVAKLKEIKESGVTYPCHKFATQYWESLKDRDAHSIKNILSACGFTDSMAVEVSKGIAIGQDLLNTSKDGKIVYDFSPQIFTKAYLRAWQIEEPVFLVIEEINRGNCAQIFGDLFQLLDRRDDGYSEYPIKADNDLAAFIGEQLSKKSRENILENIKSGEILMLPSNLYIWATMNTSDQSLFPIDSAFKRRWDWEYEPIKYKNMDWVIDINGNQYSWISFQKEVNKRIFDATNSEDKMLGDFFTKPLNGIISEKLLLNKVLFYLWNDVCKDGDSDIFRTEDNKDVKFSDLYGDNGTDMLLSMMRHLKVSFVSEYVESIDEDEDGKNEEDNDNGIRYSINGEKEDEKGKAWGKGALVKRAVEIYCYNHPNDSAAQIRDAWMSVGFKIPHIVETVEDKKQRLTGSKDKSGRERAKEVKLSNGESIYVSTEVGSDKIYDAFGDFILKIQTKPEWEIDIQEL